MNAPSRDGQSPPKALIVLHQEHSTPGRVGQELLRRGYAMDVRRPALGDRLPDTTQEYAGVLIFGGPMSANDPDEYIKREIDFIETPLEEGTLFLGICLGAQMLAKTIGGTVQTHPEGMVEIGYYDLTATNAGHALMAWPDKVYQWHREGFSTPPGTTLLATGEHYDEQAFRVGDNAYGIQFHPEITLAMLYRWTTKAHERFSLPGARPRDAHFAGRALYDDALRAWLERFLDLLLPAAEGSRAATQHRIAAE